MSNDSKRYRDSLRARALNAGGDLEIGCYGIEGVTPDGLESGDPSNLRAMLKGLVTLIGSAGALDGDLVAIGALSGTGYARRTGVDTWTLDSTVPWSSLSSTPTTLSGYGITDAQPLDADLTAIAALAGTGVARRTGANTWTLDSSIVTGSAASGQVTFWSGTGAVTGSASYTFTDQTGSGTDATLALANSQNNSGADAIFTISVGGTSAGSPQIKFDIPGDTYSPFYLILDNAEAADKFKIRATAAAGPGGIMDLLTIQLIVTANVGTVGVNRTSPIATLDVGPGLFQNDDVNIRAYTSGSGSSDDASMQTRSDNGRAYFLATSLSNNAVIGLNGNTFQIDAGTLPTSSTPIFQFDTGTFASAFSRGNLDVARAASGSSVILTLSNTSNTASSKTQHLIKVAGTTADDPFSTWQISGGNSASLGLDNSVSGDPLTCSYNTTLGSSNIWTATASLMTIVLPLTLSDDLTTTDGKNFILPTSTGTKIGTATNQLLGFWNASPVAQYSTTGTTTGFTSGAGAAVLSDSTFTGNTGSAAYTLGDVIRALKLCGIVAA